MAVMIDLRDLERLIAERNLKADVYKRQVCEGEGIYAL